MPLDRLPGWLNAVAFGILILLLPVQGKDSASPIRNTHTGLVRGSLTHVKNTKLNVHTFLGIPFAKPPVGPLRFAPPEAPEPWNGVRDGTSHPARCLQNDDIVNLEGLKKIKLFMPPMSTSEDCLYLNIYTPAHAHEGSNLPVMVWIHGGALVIGMASMYDGSMLAAIEDVVVVTIQYRLGVLGFFSTGDQHARGNWGFLDQVAALHWVQQNIAHFGGNPNQTVANLSGCETSNSEALVRCLRGKSEAEILAINKVFRIIPTVVDGEFLPRHPWELLASSDFRPVPCIIGVTNDEFGWTLPLVFGASQTIKKITRRTLQPIMKITTKEMMLPPECSDLLQEEYMGHTKDPQTLQKQFTEMVGDFLIVIPALQVAHFQRSHAPVYFYEYQHQATYLRVFRPRHVKADHGDEVFLIFGSFFWGAKFDLTVREKVLSRRMMKYWASFARYGNPNSEGLPFWPVSNQDEKYLQLNLQPSVGQTLKAKRWQFWTKTLPQKIQELKGSHGKNQNA